MQEPPERFYWLQTGFLGDIILTTAAINLASRLFPGTANILITTPLGKAALKNHPALTDVVVFDKRGGRLFAPFLAVRRQVKSLGPGILLQAHNSHRSSLLAMNLPLRRIVFCQNPLGLGALHRVDRVSVFHESHRIGMLLEPFGVTREQILDSRPTLAPATSCSLEERAKTFFAEYPRIVGIAPGSVWGTKRWPYYSELVGRYLQQREFDDVGFVLLGSASEQEQTRGIAESLQSSRLIDLAGQTSLDDLRWIYPKLSMVISNDSSPVHYGSAFNVPTLAIFGATVPEMGFGPLADCSSTIGVKLPCRPCSDHGPQVCPLNHFKCMRGLAVDLVLEKTREFLVN